MTDQKDFERQNQRGLIIQDNKPRLQDLVDKKYYAPQYILTGFGLYYFHPENNILEIVERDDQNKLLNLRLALSKGVGLIRLSQEYSLSDQNVLKKLREGKPYYVLHDNIVYYLKDKTSEPTALEITSPIDTIFPEYFNKVKNATAEDLNAFWQKIKHQEPDIFSKTKDIIIKKSENVSDETLEKIKKITGHCAFDINEQVEKLQRDFTKELTAVKVDEQHVLLWMLERIPLFTGLAQRFGKTSEKIALSVEKIAGVHHSLKELSKGFRITGLVFAAFDFIIIPLIVLGGLAQGKRLSFTLPGTVKWIYSGIILALMAAAFAVPFAAPFIAVALAAIGLATTFASMGNLFYERYHLKKELPKLHQESKGLELVREALLKQTSLIQTRFYRLPEEEKETQRVYVSEQLHELYEKLASNQQKRQTCLNQITEKSQKLDVLASPGEVVKKGIPIILGCLVLVGAALSLVFPPIGALILATTAGLGFLYTVGSMIVSYVKSRRDAIKAASMDEIPQETSGASLSILSRFNPEKLNREQYQQENEHVFNLFMDKKSGDRSMEIDHNKKDDKTIELKN